MRRMLFCLTLCLATLLLAGQALAVVHPPTYIYTPPSPDADGTYQLKWKKSVSAGVTYVLEESTDPNFATFTEAYRGPNVYTYRRGQANGTYYYRVFATNGTEDSTVNYAPGTSGAPVSVSVGLSVAAPGGLTAPATDDDGAYQVRWGKSLTAGVTYVLTEATDAAFTQNVQTTNTTNVYAAFSGKAAGTYYYKVQATLTGFTPSAEVGTAMTTVQFPLTSADCLSCHTSNPWGAGRHANADNYGGTCGQQCHIPTGEKNASGYGVIGCATCHPGAVPDELGHDEDLASSITSCAACHNSHASAVNNIADKVNGGKHFIGATTHGSASCARCHTVEGYLQSRAGVAVTAGAANVSCVACHDSHSTALRDSQYTLCTSCHQTASFYHASSWSRDITSTHFDDATTGVGVGSNVIEGYVVRASSANPCLDCHGHEFLTETGNLDRTGYTGLDVDGVTPKTYYGYTKNPAHELTLHTAWAQSAHAGGLLKAKYDAQEAYPKKNVVDGQGTILATGTYDFAAGMAAEVKKVGVLDAPIGNAWAHYNWDDNASRAGCQHCHTATGAANFLDAAANGTAYVAANNTFGHLSGWSATGGSAQNELLYCWGCHSSVETGALRTTGPIKLDYKVNGADKYLTAADGSSAACLSCHSGRGNAEGITGSNTAANPSGAAVSNPGTKSHYLAAGLTINQAQVNAGYTFGLPASSYADPAYYKHNLIGCADCHMTSAEGQGHSFEVVTKDATGVITGLVSSKCIECHDGAHGTALVAGDAAAAAFLEEEAEGYHDALKLLADVLTANGTTPTAGYPYFSGTISDQGHSGAMYNYSYLHHEPGAYAHNMRLAKRLIYDSLDWMDNKVMDGTIQFDATTYPHAAVWYGALEGTTGLYSPARP